MSPQECPPVPEGEDEPSGGAPEAVCGTVTVRLTIGADAGTEVTTDIPSGPGAP